MVELWIAGDCTCDRWHGTWRVLLTELLLSVLGERQECFLWSDYIVIRGVGFSHSCSFYTCKKDFSLLNNGACTV